MPRVPTRPFGTMLRELRLRVEGLNQRRLANYLNERVQQRKLPDYLKLDHKEIDSIETGIARPPYDSEFYKRLGAVPGVSESDITQLREAAQYELAWWYQDRDKWSLTRHEQIPGIVPEIVQEYRKLSYWKFPRFRTRDLIVFISDARRLVAEEASKNLTESLQKNDRIPILDPEKGADSTQNTLKIENPLPIHYPHTSVPDHAPQLVKEGKTWERQNKPDHGQQAPKKGTVFDRSDAKLFFEALENPNHKFNLQAEAALEGFMSVAEKARVTSLNKASKASGISVTTFTEWIAKGLIPYEYRDKNAIYLTKEIAEEVARDNEDAKEMGVQTARLLRERREKYFPPASNK
jgi:hypothetical protein